MVIRNDLWNFLPLTLASSITTTKQAHCDDGDDDDEEDDDSNDNNDNGNASGKNSCNFENDCKTWSNFMNI